MPENERSVERPEGIPSYAIDHGTLYGHHWWQIGVTDDAWPIEICANCGQQQIGILTEECSQRAR